MMNIAIPDNIRDMHVYIAGLSGYGKTSLIHEMALNDIRRGWGVCVIDPKGDLVNHLLNHIPQNRIEDTILLDTEHPVGIDFFSYREPKERELLTDDILGMFNLPESAARARRSSAEYWEPSSMQTNRPTSRPPAARPSSMSSYSSRIGSAGRRSFNTHPTAKNNGPRCRSPATMRRSRARTTAEEAAGAAAAGTAASFFSSRLPTRTAARSPSHPALVEREHRRAARTAKTVRAASSSSLSPRHRPQNTYT